MLKSIKLAIYLIVMTTCAMQASSCTHNDNIVSVSALEFEKKSNLIRFNWLMSALRRNTPKDISTER